MTELLADLGVVITNIFAYISSIAECIVSTPLLLFTVGFLFLGGCVGIFGRLLSRHFFLHLLLLFLNNCLYLYL